MPTTPNNFQRARAALRFTDVPTTGSLFFVDSNSGSALGGYTADSPAATIAQALALCTASKGDVIFVAPGHNEGIGDAQLTWNKAGVRIVGLGQGTDRPRIDYDHANASIDITASNVSVENFQLLPSVTGVAIAIDINAGVTDTIIRNCASLPGEDGAGVDEFAITVDIKSGCDRTLIDGCRFTQHASSTGVNSCVKLTGASDLISIKNCEMWSAGSGLIAPINGDTTLSTRLLVENCVLTADDEPGIELLTGTTGVFRNVDIFSNLATVAAATVADGVAHFRVRYVEVGNESDAAVKTASVDD